MSGLDYNRIVYGIHNISPYNPSTGLPYGTLKVLGGGTMTLSSEVEELFGGSNKFAWAVEAKTISAEWTATVKSMPDFAFELFLGATTSAVAASTSGTVGALTNVNGTSVFDATTGIASISAKSGSEADLKDGVYVVIAASATTVDVYNLTDIEFNKIGGTALSYVDASLKITATPLTITASTAVEIPNTGLELTGGSGAIAMTIGDTATSNVKSVHNGLSTITIGKASTIFPEHGQLCVAQKRSNGDTFEIELFKVIGTGMPIPLEEQAFSIPELAMRLIYDSEKDKVAEIRAKRG